MGVIYLSTSFSVKLFGRTKPETGPRIINLGKKRLNKRKKKKKSFASVKRAPTVEQAHNLAFAQDHVMPVLLMKNHQVNMQKKTRTISNKRAKSKSRTNACPAKLCRNITAQTRRPTETPVSMKKDEKNKKASKIERQIDITEF
jgi:hypothetical protein